MNEKEEALIARIIKFCKKTAFWIGIFLITISFVPIDDIDEKWALFVRNVISTLGGSFLSMALVTIFNDQWTKDFTRHLSFEEMDLLARKLRSSIDPTVPKKVYEQRNTPGKELGNDLIEDLKKSTRLLYSGVRMTVSANCLRKVFSEKEFALNSLHFFIPKPENAQLSKVDLAAMKESIETIQETFINSQYSRKIHLNFTLLDIIPPFHIHHTDNRSWFGAVIISDEGVPYPTTYLFERMIQNNEQEKTSPNNMYNTMDWMMKGLIEHAKSKGNKDNCFVTLNANSDKVGREEAFRKPKGEIVISELVNRINDALKA